MKRRGCLFRLVLLLLAVIFPALVMGREQLILSALLMIMFIGLILLAYRFIQGFLFRIKAKKIEATIVDFEREGEAEQFSYYPIVEYTVPNGSYKKSLKEAVVKDIPHQHEPTIGRKIWIFYNPKKPMEIIEHSPKSVIFHLAVGMLMAFMMIAIAQYMGFIDPFI